MKLGWKAALVPLIVVAVYVACEVRWARVNDPAGKFGNVAEYVAHGRLPRRIGKMQRGGETFYIAFGPSDFWLAFPSGPAAYAFDASGELVQWSHDYGDDPTFRSRWPMGRQEEISLEELVEAVKNTEKASEPLIDANGRE